MIFQNSINNYLRIVFFPLIIIHIIFLENLRFTLWPEMMVYPYLVNNGFSLYKDLINPYPPTLILFLSLLTKIFGYQPQMFQIFTWLIVLIIDYVLYQVILKISKNHYISIFSFTLFLIVSVPFGINELWFDLIQSPFIILSVYYFIKYYEKRNISNLNFSFIFVLTAFLIKQQALWLFLAYVVILIFSFRKNIVHLSFKLLPALIFFIAVCIEFTIYFYKTNTLSEFLNWAVYFPFIKASKMPGYLSLPTVKQSIPIVLITMLSLPSIFSLKPKRLYYLPIIISLLFFAFPRFDYFHLIPALAVISLFIGPSLKLISKFSLIIKAVYSFLIILIVMYAIRFITRNISTEIRFFEPEIQTAANITALTTIKNEPLYIQNGPDQIYPLASRLPVKPWADEFPWYLENGNLQQIIIESLKNQRPRFIVVQPYSEGERFNLGSYRPQMIADFLDKNYQNNYQISKTLWLKKKI